MVETIFLSAGIPDPSRSPEFAETANSVAITSAVNALLFVTLGRRRLVWGGHPAITPIVWETCSQFGVEYQEWVSLYQTLFFEDEFPEDNDRFGNTKFTEKFETREESLFHMRTKMFSDSSFSAAVFVGGMDGIIDELNLFQELQPDGAIIPVASTGGAALQILEHSTADEEDLLSNLDYVALFHEQLGIPTQERRYSSPGEQPALSTERVWQRNDPPPDAN